MALKAAGASVLVTPTGDNSETEKGRLIVVGSLRPENRIYRGVVRHVGKHVTDDIERGDVVHYSAYTEFRAGEDELHVVPVQYLILIEDDE